MQRHALASVVVLSFLATTIFAREPAEVVYDKVHPSVVSLRNAEGSGTGVLLNRSGLILTNAHVVMSPLPFEAKVDMRIAGQQKSATFRRVTLVGIHPTYDLALVKVDPAENKGLLTAATLAKEMPKPGRTVYAIGNPGGGDVILTKTITAGLLSGIREMEGQTYLQVSAAINPGNSGGPLCDGQGNVIGIVTFKLNDVDNIGFAIPVNSFNVSQFVPWDKRKSDTQATNTLAAAAAKYIDQADAYRRQFGDKDQRVMVMRAMALRCYWLALMNSPGNSDLFYNVGMVYGRLDEQELAIAYLVRALQLDAWGSDRGDYYRELGLALMKLNRHDEGFIVYREGTAKYPRAGKMYEDMAITHGTRANWPDCAYAAQMGLKVGDTRANVLSSLNTQATGNLNAAQQAQLKQKVAAIDADLKRLQTAADKAKTGKVKHLNKEFEALLKRLGTLEDPEAAAAELARAREPEGAGREPARPARPDRPEKPAKDADTVWIENQLDLARLYAAGKQWDKVKEICTEIIARHPDHALTKDARTMQARAEKEG